MDRAATEALLATTQARIGAAWQRTFAHLREENTVAAIAKRIEDRQFERAIVGLDESAAAFAGGEHAAYVHAGQTTARTLRDLLAVRKKLAVFDASDPQAVAWAQKNRLDKIREITEDQRNTIRGVLVRGARAGTNPLEMARELRESLGLTARQEQIVANYRRDLLAGGARLRAALERQLTGGAADRTLMAAIRDNRAVPEDRVEVMVATYRQNWRTYRAETIGRTEGLRVAHQASDELYQQAVDKGDIQPAQIERKWVHRKRPGSRDFHAVMNGQIRGFGEAFISGRGTELRYPGDPTAGAEETAGCTCVVVTRLRRGEARAAVEVREQVEAEAIEATEPVAEIVAGTAVVEAEEAGEPPIEIVEPALVSDPAAAEFVESERTFDDIRLEEMADRAPLAEGSVNALMRGDLRDLSSVMRDDLEARWRLARRDTDNDRFTAGLPGGGEAERTWNGDIRATPEVYGGARLFAERYAADPVGFRAELADVDALQFYTQPEAVRRAGGDGMRVLIHEQVHGYGPVTADLFSGPLAAIEEVATEVMARTVMREEFGLNLRSESAAGAYWPQIKATLSAIQGVGGVTVDEAWDVLERAALKFKSTKPNSAHTHDDLVETFADQLAAHLPGGATLERRLAIMEVLDSPELGG